MKEHGGGAPPAGFSTVPVEWVEDNPQPVSITHFDFDSLDSFADQVRECVLKGGDLGRLLKLHKKMLGYDFKAEGFNCALSGMLQAKNPKLYASQMAFACGSDLVLGLSGPELARRHGVSKQAFFQGVERIRLELGVPLRITNQRDDEARAKFARRNYRRKSSTPP